MCEVPDVHARWGPRTRMPRSMVTDPLRVAMNDDFRVTRL